MTVDEPVNWRDSVVAMEKDDEVAVIVTLPSVKWVTKPDEFTVATPVLDEDQVIVAGSVPIQLTFICWS